VIAQQVRIPQVGFLISETLPQQKARVDALLAGLRGLGYIEGKSIAIEFRAADGNYDRLPGLAAELVRLKVDVLVAFGSKAAVAAKGATTTVPIVIPNISDPVSLGIVTSLSKPGGNITGTSDFAEISAKRLEILKEAVPRIARVGVLVNSANRLRQSATDAMHTTAKALKLELRTFEVRSSSEFAAAFAAMTKARINALYVSGDTLFQAHWTEIADLATKQHLPSVGRKEYSEAGGLIGYGVDDAGLYRHAASFIDRILKGAKPADIPVELPTRFELTVNAKTAKALGLTIPRVVLVRADQVLE
jgi:putative ABC transport system substrate-binding protein